MAHPDIPTDIEYRNFGLAHPETSTWNDRWAVEAVFKGQHGGFCIEAGACNGKAGSCTYVLEEYFGWSGLLFEPITSWFESLIKNRPNSHCVNALLDGPQAPSAVDFLHFVDSPGYSTIDAYRGPQHEKLIADGENFVIEQKPVRQLGAVLDEVKAPLTIDYVAFDLNGAEFEVLSTFPHAKYQFRAISIEGDDCSELLTSLGYVEARNPFTTVAFEKYFLHPSEPSLETLAIE